MPEDAGEENEAGAIRSLGSYHLKFRPNCRGSVGRSGCEHLVKAGQAASAIVNELAPKLKPSAGPLARSGPTDAAILDSQFS